MAGRDGHRLTVDDDLDGPHLAARPRGPDGVGQAAQHELGLGVGAGLQQVGERDAADAVREVAGVAHASGGAHRAAHAARLAADAGQELGEPERVAAQVEGGVGAAAGLLELGDERATGFRADGEGAELADREVVVQRRVEDGVLGLEQADEQTAGGLRVVVGELDQRAAQRRVGALGAAARQIRGRVGGRGDDRGAVPERRGGGVEVGDELVVFGGDRVGVRGGAGLGFRGFEELGGGFGDGRARRGEGLGLVVLGSVNNGSIEGGVGRGGGAFLRGVVDGLGRADSRGVGALLGLSPR